MTDTATQESQAQSFLDMSDEDIMKMSEPPAQIEEEKDVDPDNPDGDLDKQQDAAAKSDEKVSEDEDKETSAEGDDDEAAGKPAEEESAEGDKSKSSEEKASDEAGSEESTEEDKKTSEEESKIDFEAEYKRLLAPFKANGREIAVKSVDDAITLMQMGANYNKKMAALKPNLKLMKLLENNGLLSEEKISFLIDLEKKNPAAINKLVKDSGIDPMDLDAEKASAYKQTAYTVDDREIELDTVLDELQGTSSYNRTLDIVGNKWDAASKQVIAGNPAVIKVINDHVQSGIYDLIAAEIENDRLFGRLNGLSDIEAYRQVGDRLHAAGAFNHLVQGSSQTQGKTESKQVVVPPKPKKEDEDKLKDKRRAASSTKPAAPSTTPKDFNPLALSDEEFSKLVNKQYL